MHKFGFNPISENQKTGPIPVTISSRTTCPDSCKFKGTSCYAEGFPMRIHWDRVDREGITFKDLLTKIRKLRPHQLWRHNQAGDLPGENNKICSDSLQALTNANKGRKGFTYTHYSVTSRHNEKAIREANKNGFTVNVSTETESDAEFAHTLGLPVVLVVRHDEQRKSWKTETHQIDVKTCPAAYMDITCDTCRFCQKLKVNTGTGLKQRPIVAFPAHGIRKKSITKMLQVIN